jgi:hypothetical protein
MAFTQDFRTQRRNYNDGDTRIDRLDRIWYDSITQTIRIGDGVTPGGCILALTESFSINSAARLIQTQRIMAQMVARGQI